MIGGEKQLSSKVGGASAETNSSQPLFEGIRLPGASASTFSGRAILQSLLRFVLGGKSRLGSFARSFVCQQFAPGTSLGTAPNSLFPMGLPFPEVFRKGSSLSDAEAARKKGITAIVIGLNFLHLNRPRSVPVDAAICTKLSKAQWDAIDRFGMFLGAWISVSPIGPSEMGRTASKVETLEDVLRSLEKTASSLAKHGQGYFGAKRQDEHPGRDILFKLPKIGNLDLDPFSTFKPVDPSRLTFVGRPSFDPSPYLDELGRKVFEEPMEHRMDPSLYIGKVPLLRVHCSKSKKLDMLALLDASGRLGIHLPAEVTPKFSSGLFAVVKDLERDRLILDSRGANLLERPAQRWIQSLACSESLCKLLVGPQEVVLTNGNDIRDFYYLFRASLSRSRRNSLVGAVHAKQISHLNAVKAIHLKHGLVFASLATLAMGDTQAVEIAQTCHLGLSLAAKTATPDSLLTLTRPIPRCKTMTGLVIDDFITISVVPQEQSDKPSEAAQLADQMQDMYEDVHLIPNKKKAFRDSLSGTFWGADLDGASGIIRGSLKRAIPVCGLVLQVCKLGVATGELLQTLTGSIISLFLFRRRLMSLMDSLFGSYRNENPRSMLKLSGRLHDDLLLMVMLMPLAACNLRASVSNRITATDASNTAEAAVVASLPDFTAREIYRHVLRKGVWTRLLSPSAAWRRGHALLEPLEELPEEGDCFKCHPLWQVLAECLDYDLLYCKKVSKRRHINIGELRAILRSERIHGQHSPSSREIYAVDSQVALGTILKGRSGSVALNQELVRSLPCMLGYDTYSEGIYFETSLNRGDDPTRSRAIRGPSKLLPDWWPELAKGNVEPFDEWMHHHGIHPDDISGLPCFSELYRGEAARLEEEKMLKRMFVPTSPSQPDEKRQDGVVDHKDNNRPIKEPADTLGGKEGYGEACNSGGATRPGDLCYAVNPLQVDPCFPEPLGECQDSRPPRSSCKVLPFDDPANDSPPEVKPQVSPPRDKPHRSSFSPAVLEILKKFKTSQVVFGDSSEWPPMSPGYLDLFSGKRGVAHELASITNTWVLCFDLEHSLEEDLSSPTLRQQLEFLISSGVFLGLGGGPVCKSFSMAITPPIRSLDHPYGRPDVSDKIKLSLAEGNSFALWMFKLLDLGIKHKLAVWLENPASSWMFRIPAWRALALKRPELRFWIVDYCRFGKRWRKRTRIVSNTPLGDHKTLCKGGHSHLLLRGRSKKDKKSWTLVAQSYPAGVSFAIAVGVALESKKIQWNSSFDPAQCARCTHARIGEAANPGPMPSRYRAPELLEDINLVEPKTLAIQDRVWKGFLGWVTELLSPGAARSAMAVPELFSKLLNEYGLHFPLYLYRHLIVLVQKNFPSVKLHLGCCWDTITRWEICEPTVHRVPIPDAILKAILAVSLGWKWFHFSCIVGISYYGISRPGEPLRAVRSDLVLPSDRLDSRYNIAFLQIRNPKSRRRGRGQVQHISIEDKGLVRLLEKTYGSKQPDEPLFPGSGVAFRRRWDAVIESLDIPTGAKLTPGGLRGGGCVHSFTGGCDIPRLMWKMRIKHQATLESYLQEVVATTVFPSLPASSRRKIVVAQSTLPLFLSGG